MKQFRQIFTLLLLPLDYLMVLASFILAYTLKVKFFPAGDIYIYPFAEYLTYAIYSPLIWVLVFLLIGLYRFRGFRNGWELTGKVILGSTVALAVFIVVLFLTRSYFLSRLTIVYILPVSIVLVLAGRAFLEEIKNWFQNYGIGTDRMIIIGNKTTADQLGNYYVNFKPALRIVDTIPSISFDKLDSYHNITRVLVDYEPEASEMVKLIRWCEDRGITFQYVPSLVGVYASRMEVDTVNGYPLIELSPTPLVGWGRVVKRLFDLILTTIGLIILSPIMLLLAIAVRLDSKGPIFFAQERVGELGTTFTFYKFRSMKTEFSTGAGYGGKKAEAMLEKLRKESNEADGPMFKMENDPRVTKVGRFIRKTSLDELPQLFNVFIGNMSLVGPRPALPNEVAQYEDAAKRRLLIKPGVTGMWQVSGRNDVTFDEYIRLDTYYIENWSLWLDVKIILLTFKAIFTRTGK